jgi:PEP-CTERM motif-containing protein
MRLNLFRLALATAVIVVASSNEIATAAINIANGSPVIGGSGDYPGGPFNSGLFPSLRVTDGVLASPDNNTGNITEVYGTGYWLGPNNASTGYFVLDLGAAYNIGSVQLFNTGNAQFQDRGTGNFTISASNSIVFIGSNGMDLVSPTQIVSGSLTPQSAAAFLTPDSFTAGSSGPFRYLRFDALSIGAIGSFGFNGVGLNEIRVFEAAATTPEPSTFIVLAAVGGIGYRLRRKLSALMS